MADSKLKALKAYLNEAADSYLLGFGDEMSALAESIPSAKGLIDKPWFGERFSRNLEDRQKARTKMQDENRVASGLGGLTGTFLSPAARVASFPARVATSAAEEVGRSDPQSALDFLKALALGSAQGTMQYAVPDLAEDAAKMKKRSMAKAWVPILDLTQSNAFPGIERKLEEDKRKREEEEARARAMRSKP
jgi:hypothetical protein